MLDVAIAAKGRFSTPVADGHNALLYVIDGAVEVGPSATVVRQGQVAVLADRGDVLARSRDGGRFLLFAGRPVAEPVARSGPFVMNTDDELQQAWDDYRFGEARRRGVTSRLAHRAASEKTTAAIGKARTSTNTGHARGCEKLIVQPMPFNFGTHRRRSLALA